MYVAIPLRIYLIMMSIGLHHYKILKDNNILVSGSNDPHKNNHNNSIILQKELDKWKNYSDILRKPNRNLFNQMLQSAYKYSLSLDAKGGIMQKNL